MNRAYRSIYNERTGTFVAVAEHSKARGKKSSSAKQIATAATLGVSLLMGGPALADIVLDEAQNKIEFTQAGGTIDFGSQGQIKGLQQLSVSGVLDANQVLVNSAEPLTNTSRYVVTGAQLYATNQNVAQLNQSLSQTTQSLTQTADRLAQTDTALDQLEAQVVQHENQLVDHSTQLANHETQLTQQATTIQSIETTLLDAGIDANTPGVKYFRTNSQAADAQALGAESIAIGPQAKAVGDSSIALGEASQSAANKSMALGSQASVDSEFATRSIAIGQSAKVTGNSEDALAIGSAAQAQDRAALAIGHEANAQSVNSLALGSAAKASAANTVALGAGASAEADGNVAIGLEAGVGSNLGPVTPGLDRTNQVMIGTRAGQSIEGNQNTAIGFEAGNNTTSNYFVAIGNQAGQGLKGNENISVGHQANKQATGTPIEHAISIGSKTEAGSFSVVLGEQAKASSTNTVAIGQQTKVSGAYGVALGAQAQASGSSVALGARSVATTSSGRGFLTDFNADLNNINVVSLGQAGQERRLTHVAAGSVDTDGVNVSQLRAAQSNLADLLGDGVMDANGKITGFKVNGNTYQSVAQVIGELNAGGLTPQLPAGAVMYTADSTATNSKINLQGTEGTVISNLAMAANPDDNDAVNVAYLNQQLSENQVHYISVNSQEATNRNNNEANGLNSIAIGPDTVTSGTAASSVAIGHSALAADLAAQSVVLGNAVTADQQRSVVIGVESHTYGTSNIAIGDDAHSHGANSIVIGQNAKVDPKIPGGDSDNGIALGTKAKVSAESGTAIGHDATASALHASALGFEAYATGTRSSALGSQANASGADSFAQGTLSVASAQNSQAQGTQARATATDGIAMGTEAVSGMLNPDPNQQVNNINTIAIGKSASASFKNAMATGTQAQATHENTIASGFQAEATAGNAMALGANAKAAHERAVALGEGAQTSAAVSTTGATIDKKDYVYAGQQPIATVSVGSAGNERTITHVAAGRVSATSTDAINGSQLYGAHVAINDLGDDLDTAGQSVADALGGGSSYNPNTHKVTASLNVQGNTYTTVNEAINYAAQGWSLTAHGVAGAEAIKPGGTANFSSGKNIVVERTGNTITYKTADDVEFNQVQVDNSITIGDDITNQTVINQGSASTTNLTVTGETKLGDHFTVTNQGDVHYDGPITDATHIVNKEYVDTAEAGLTAKGMNFVGSDGQVIHKDLGDTLGIVGG
ncbi:ESPR-type extended signal peptide-containing protein, partial [Paenalcaligenes hominis]|uniref:ESPR-type extended signal peptide-containing protein n=1 Tax=Paenalcaligenes hominis TaxID=643674 RepID=UPI003525CE0B